VAGLRPPKAPSCALNTDVTQEKINQTVCVAEPNLNTTEPLTALLDAARQRRTPLQVDLSNLVD
jgi:hypothetical protein